MHVTVFQLFNIINQKLNKQFCLHKIYYICIHNVSNMLSSIKLIKGIHPGFILDRELKKHHIAKGRFALSLNEYPQTLVSITKGKRNMNTALALKIEKALGMEEGYCADLGQKTTPKFAAGRRCPRALERAGQRLFHRDVDFRGAARPPCPQNLARRAAAPPRRPEMHAHGGSSGIGRCGALAC